MNDIEHIDELFNIHQRRLRVLQLRAATKGIDVEPAVILEIENINTEMKLLEQQRSDYERVIVDIVRLRETVVRITNEIEVFLAGVLEDNQSILITYLVDQKQRAQVYEKMFRLFHLQQGRGKVGRWRGLLSGLSTRDMDIDVINICRNIETLISYFVALLYEPHPEASVIARKGKQRVIKLLAPANMNTIDGLSDDKIADIIFEYLESLRCFTEMAGELHGRALALC